MQKVYQNISEDMEIIKRILLLFSEIQKEDSESVFTSFANSGHSQYT